MNDHVSSRGLSPRARYWAGYLLVGLVLPLGVMAGEPRVRQRRTIQSPIAVSGTAAPRHTPTATPMDWRTLRAQGESADPEAVPALIRALESDHVGLRIEGAKGLKNYQDPSAIPALGKALADPNAVVRKNVAEALGRFRTRETAVLWLGALTQSQYPDVRAAATAWVAADEEPGYLEALGHALQDEDVGVRRQVVLALAHATEPPAKTLVFQALTNTDKATRLQAVRTMGNWRDEEAAAQLAEAAGSNPYEEIRYEAAMWLGESTHPAAIEELLNLLTRKGAPEVRMTVARVLAHVKDARVVPALGLALSDGDARVREAAMIALGQSTDPKSTESVTSALTHTDVAVRWWAAKILSDSHRPEVLAVLVATAGAHAFPEIRQQALIGLANFQASNFREPLVVAMKDADPWIALQAAGVLAGEAGWVAGADKEWLELDGSQAVKAPSIAPDTATLEQELRSPEPVKRLRAIMAWVAFGKRGPKAYPSVAASLKQLMKNREVPNYLQEAARQTLERWGAILTRAQQAEQMKKALIP